MINMLPLADTDAPVAPVAAPAPSPLESQCAQLLYDQWVNGDGDDTDWMQQMFGTADDNSDTEMNVSLAVINDPNVPAAFNTTTDETVAITTAIRWDVVRDLCADKIGCEDRAAAFGGTPCQGWCHCLHSDNDNSDDPSD